MMKTIFLKAGRLGAHSTGAGWARGSASRNSIPNATFVGSVAANENWLRFPFVYAVTMHAAASEMIGTQFHHRCRQNLLLGGAQTTAATGTAIKAAYRNSVL